MPFSAVAALVATPSAPDAFTTSSSTVPGSTVTPAPGGVAGIDGVGAAAVCVVATPSSPGNGWSASMAAKTALAWAVSSSRSSPSGTVGSV